MGEYLFRKVLFAFFTIIFLSSFSFSAFAGVHSQYSSFSSPENGFVFNNASNLVSITDTAVYRTGYYSINGSSWIAFNFSGTLYNNNSNWLRGLGYFYLPNPGSGEHYAIVYSCTYNTEGSSWDCHDGKWQLIIITKNEIGTRYLVKEGLPVSDIVVSSSAPNSVKLAANYFQYYIYNMTGANLSVSNSPDTNYGFHVYIGQSNYTDLIGINADGCRDGGFKIFSGEDYLVLLGEDDTQNIAGFGGNPGPRNFTDWDSIVNTKWGEQYLWDNDFLRFHYSKYHSQKGIWETDKMGSMNAVFEFLYGQGVRFYHPGWYEYPDLGTIIPEKTDISFEYTNRLVNPDFSMRDFMLYSKEYANIGSYHWDGRSEEEIRWVLSLRSNNFYEFLIADMGGPSHGLRSVTVRQYDVHPEFYSMNSTGGREIPGTVDYSNQDLCYPYYTEENTLFEESVKYAKTMFDVYNISIVNMMPSDGFGRISYECKNNVTSFSNYIWEFVNNVAWEIYNDGNYEGKMISCSAYTPYGDVPTGLSRPPAPNLVVNVGRQRNQFGNDYTRTFYENRTLQWLAFLASNNDITGGIETNILFTSDYYGNNRVGASTQGLPMYAPHLISNDLKFLKGISMGEYMEIATSEHWPPYNQTSKSWDVEWDLFAANSFNIYVLSRLYWDADQDVDALLDEYCLLFYGPASEEMKEFIEYSELHMAEAFSDPVVVPTLKSMLSAARAKAGNNYYGYRIDLLIGLMNSQFNQNEILIDSCSVLNSPFTTYKLTKDVSSSGRCFTINHFAITLDCQGHTITHTVSGDNQEGIYSAYKHGGTIKNCKIVQLGNTSFSYVQPIRLYSGRDATILNTTIESIGTGMWLIDMQRVNVTGVTITSEAGIPLSTQNVYNSYFIGNDLYAQGAYQGIYLYRANNSIASGNRIISEGNSALVIMRTGNTTVINNYLETRSATSQPLRELECTGNTISNNTLVTP